MYKIDGSGRGEMESTNYLVYGRLYIYTAHLRHNRYSKFGRTSSLNRTKEQIPSEPSTTDITKLLSSLRGINGYFCCCCVERIRLS
jgi:hypothetical protein